MGNCCYEHNPADFVRIENRIARKNYKCCECGIPINPQDQYQLAVMLEDGNWYDYKSCIPCADLRDALAEVDCPYYEGLAECYTNYLTETVGIVMSVKKGSHAARLVPGYFVEEEGE